LVFTLPRIADVRFGTQRPGKDLEQNTIATYPRAGGELRANGIRRIVFSSTGSVYGVTDAIPTGPEDRSLSGNRHHLCMEPRSSQVRVLILGPTARAFGFQSWIFRFVSIPWRSAIPHGSRLRLFTKQLKADRSQLRVLGDGKQRILNPTCISRIASMANAGRIGRRRPKKNHNHIQLGRRGLLRGLNDSIGLDMSGPAGGTSGWNTPGGGSRLGSGTIRSYFSIRRRIRIAGLDAEMLYRARNSENSGVSEAQTSG